MLVSYITLLVLLSTTIASSMTFLVQDLGLFQVDVQRHSLLIDIFNETPSLCLLSASLSPVPLSGNGRRD